jgi:putative FmdB family regulatory protein
MPLYEYRCKKCGHHFEKIQSFSAPDEKECPVCKGEVERLISAPSFQFKGTGWYVNDYPSKGSRHASRPSESSGNGKSAASSESKPAASTTSSD